MTSWETLLVGLTLAAAGALFARWARPPGELLDQVQEERTNMQKQRDSLQTQLDNAKAEIEAVRRQAVESVTAARAALATDLAAARAQISDLRTTADDLHGLVRDLQEYIGVLRRGYTDLGATPPEWPAHLRQP